MSTRAHPWRVRGMVLDPADHTLVMGILNVTPDSFSDGGRFSIGSGAWVDAAVDAGVEMWAAGADIVDVGGESTRPGADPTDPSEERRRVEPVVAGLVARGVPVSIDTRRPAVAAAALDAGAVAVNDVSGLGDPDMAPLCADRGCGVVVMHMKGVPATMQNRPGYTDVVAEVAEWLQQRAHAAETAGVAPDAICIDPGIGFGKRFGDNLDLLAATDRLVATGRPVLIGASRKRFLGEILDRSGHPAATASDRDDATGAVTALAVAAGVTMVRVHNVPAALQSARTADAIVRRTSTTSGRSGE